MGNSLSRGTLDVIYILFPFVLSAGLIISIVVCWWKCKLLVANRRRPNDRRKVSKEFYDPEDADFGHLINIQEYAENQVGTTIVYADSPGSSYPHPYVYFSDGRITRILPLTPSSTIHAIHQEIAYPSSLCNTFTRNNNIHNHLHSSLVDRASSIRTTPTSTTPISSQNNTDVENHVAATSMKINPTTSDDEDNEIACDNHTTISNTNIDDNLNPNESSPKSPAL